MNRMITKLNRRFISLALLLSVAAAQAGGYSNLSIAVYFRYQEVQSTPNNLAQFSNSWANVEKQVKVDKVYLETTRNRELATDTAVTAMKKFFADRGIKASGGLGLTVQESAGFQSYCYPMVISARYGQGTFYILAIPDDFADLYRLPQSVLDQIRSLLGREVFVSLSSPDHVSLFAYDNRTFIVQNFQSQPVSTRVSVVRATRLRDLLSGQTIASAQGGEAAGGGRGGGRGGRGGFGGGGGTSFEVAVPAHSFRVFAAE